MAGPCLELRPTTCASWHAAVATDGNLTFPTESGMDIEFSTCTLAGPNLQALVASALRRATAAFDYATVGEVDASSPSWYTSATATNGGRFDMSELLKHRGCPGL